MARIAVGQRRDITSERRRARWRKLAAASFPGFFLLLSLFFFIPRGSRAAERPESAGLRGHLLVATTQLHELPFAETVVYILEHDAQGAVGLIINRPIGNTSFADILRDKAAREAYKGREIALYYGGPVQWKRGFLLHSTDVMLETSRVIADGVAMTSDTAMLGSIAEGNGPKKYLFALGYAGWRSQQLEAEIERGSWFTVDADASLVFAEDPAQTWKRLTEGRIFRL